MRIEEAFDIIALEAAEYERLRIRQEAARAAAKEHMKAAGITEWEGPGARLVLTTTVSMRLDTSRVKLSLGARLPSFQYAVTSEHVKLVPSDQGRLAGHNVHSQNPDGPPSE
ncbi:MAG: hypothetical protein IT372_42490 [Polyangiaceae bacterium]|nr:hypothetical protein [Polyangiaceae bacterium]